MKQQRELQKALRRSQARQHQPKVEVPEQGRFLSIEEARSALRDSLEASRELLEAAEELVELARERSRETVSQEDFIEGAQALLTSVKRLSNKIRGDDLLMKLAPGCEPAVPGPTSELDAEGFVQWSESLLEVAVVLERRIAYFYEDRDFTQVSTDQLNLPSAKSLCNSIEILSVTLKNSLGRPAWFWLPPRSPSEPG